MLTNWKFKTSKPGVPASATFECAHCRVHSLHTYVGTDVHYRDREDIKLTLPPGSQVKSEWRDRFVPCMATYTHWLMRCVNCEKDTYILTRSQALPLPGITVSVDEADWLKSLNLVIHHYPVWIAAVDRSVPLGVSGAAVEAEKCLAIGAYNACGVMTRRAIHSLCEDKKAEGRDLFAQLKDLKANQLITPDLHEWADSLRMLGRDGAHPEFPEVTAEDAEDGMKLLREIVKFVYILPHERAENRKRSEK
jgi:hypothetical protein